MPSVWTGVDLAIAICVVFGAGLTFTSSEFPQRQQELFAGLVALVATTMLTFMVFWMKKALRSIKSNSTA